MSGPSDQTPPEDVEISIPLETVCFIIMKAREFSAKDVSSETNDGSNPSDDGDTAVLEDNADDPVLEELKSLISDLSFDEQIDLVALAWLGREENPDDWSDVRSAALDAHNDHTADYLCGNPLLADNLSDGLSALDLSCAAFEAEHL